MVPSSLLTNLSGGTWLWQLVKIGGELSSVAELRPLH